MSHKPMEAKLTHSFQAAAKTINQFIADANNIALTTQVAKGLAAAFEQGNKVLICGNGGSACDAMHFAEELTGRYRQDRRALPALSLTDPGFLTCAANDFGYEQVFARGVEAYGQAGDWLIVLSTSGNSENVLRAVQQAKQQSMTTFALLGPQGGQLRGQCDVELLVPGATTDRIQELHMTILHIVVEGVERVLFPQHYK